MIQHPSVLIGGIADNFGGSFRLGGGRVPGHAEMLDQDLGDLEADREHGVEGGQRVLQGGLEMLALQVPRQRMRLARHAAATRTALATDYTYLQPAQPTTLGHLLLTYAYPALVLEDAGEVVVELYDVSAPGLLGAIDALEGGESDKGDRQLIVRCAFTAFGTMQSALESTPQPV